MEKTAKQKRRKFLQAGLMSMAAVAVSSASPLILKAKAEVKKFPEPYVNNGNLLERMRKELIEALKKPVEKRKWGMVLDLRKCIGCKACTVACASENNLSPGVLYRPVMEEEIGKFPNVRKRFIPRPCLHCDNPPCVPVCPVTATYKRKDGIVVVDYDICIGCRNCLVACPYNARTSDFGEFYGEDTPQIMDYELRPTYEYSKVWKRDPKKHNSPMGNARKCHFCLHRIREGILPSCVTTCLGGATYFGDLNNPRSLVSELIANERTLRLKEYLHTKPSVFYLY